MMDVRKTCDGQMNGWDGMSEEGTTRTRWVARRGV